MTRLLGPQYQRSRRRIELDLTWACNLKCHNCNRSCTQSPTGERLEVSDVERFVTDSLERGIRWDRIRLLGGEPTLHPDLSLILFHLDRYRATSPDTLIQICSNGYGAKVNQVLATLPHWLVVENTMKASVEQPFVAFNVAPVDRRLYQNADFTNGCWVTANCGMGLTPRGYQPCAVAGGIERVTEAGKLRRDLPLDDDSMDDLLQASCALCGSFDRIERRPISRPLMSASWRALYRAEKARGRRA